MLLRDDHCEEIAKAYKELLEISGVKFAKGCFHYTAAHIWPYKFVLHLLSTLTSRGSSSVNLQTNTPVTEISETPDPVTGAWTVVTESRGSIKAKKVILATNAYTAAIAPQYADRIVPIRGICSRIVTPEKKTPPYLPNTYSLQWGAEEYDYLIPRPDGSIIVGGGRKDYVADLESWYNNTDDREPIQSAKNYFDGYMQHHIIGWEDSDAYTEQVWSGEMGFSTDLLPHVGPIPGEPNQYILAGFSGHGMPMAFLPAKGIAKMIRNDEESGDLPFEKTGIPRLYKTTRERLECDRNDILAVKFGVDKVKARGKVWI
ncbi:hypothetical protein PABG_01197 [Paracoccidioides brasiliensis Pb03]|nr:hypothetical protein PABG_01197 [Paracoccidioides brasiliensis Pb03]